MKKILLLLSVLAAALLLVGCAEETTTETNNGVAVGEPNPATPDFSAFDVVCTQEQKGSQICTREYKPVCGNDGETYSNGCMACSAQVDAYNAGACGETGETTQVLDHVCSSDERTAKICTLEYDPVCGADGQTYGNGCGACAADLDGWSFGECDA